MMQCLIIKILSVVIKAASYSEKIITDSGQPKQVGNSQEAQNCFSIDDTEHKNIKKSKKFQAPSNKGRKRQHRKRNPHHGKDPCSVCIHGFCSASLRQLLCIEFLNLRLESVDLCLQLLDGRKGKYP